MSIDRSGLRTWIEIDTEALKHNYAYFRERIKPGCKLMAVVNANAYGHSMEGYAKNLESFGADWFGVDEIGEGIRLRKAGIKKPVLVMGYTLPELLAEALTYDLTLTISSFDDLTELARLHFEKPFKAHIKVDTGTHRQGFLPSQIDELIIKLNDISTIEVTGLFSHLADAGDINRPEYSRKQFETFLAIKKQFEAAGYTPLSHLSASAGTLNFPEMHLDMVRVGIEMIGVDPTVSNSKSEARSTKQVQSSTNYVILSDSEESRRQPHIRPDMSGLDPSAMPQDDYIEGVLRPILVWKTIVSEIKSLPKGELIGYDCTEQLERDSVIGICPVGYWHGYTRGLSSKAHVLVNGQRCKVLGRVCMDMIMIDLTDLPGIKPLDVVTLIGRDGGETVTAEELSEIAGQSPYEFLTRINPYIKRFYA